MQCHIDSIKLTSHKRLPIYKKSTKRLSYKLFQIETFERALQDQQETPLKKNAFFSNLTEIVSPEPMSIEQEIEMAMQRDRWSTSTKTTPSRPTTHSLIEVGEGEGRFTREIEVIWWPELFPTTMHGKLEIRFFLKKVSL